MREFVQKQNHKRKDNSFNLARSLKFSPVQKPHSDPSPSYPAVHRFGHDFSRIPVHSNAPTRIHTTLENVIGELHEPMAEYAAQQVLHTPQPQLLQRTCACGGGCPKCRNEHYAHEDSRTNRAQPNGSAETTVPPTVHEALRSSGQPMDITTQRFMESRFGHDFSRVRVHTDTKATEATRSVGAVAFTLGPNIVFASGQYSPESITGRKLLIHELVHVIQQRDSQPLPHSSLRLGEPGDRFEQEADRIATNAASPANGIQRIDDRHIQRQVDSGETGGQGQEESDDREKYRCLVELMDSESWRYEDIMTEYVDSPFSKDTFERIRSSLTKHLTNKVFADCNCCGQIVSVTVKEAPPSRVFATEYPPDTDDPTIQSLGERAVRVADGQYFIEMHVKMNWGPTGACGCV